MRRSIIAFAVIIGLAAFGSVGAGELPHYFTPSGFRLPVLSQGEYIVSGRGYYYNSSRDVEYNDTLPRGARSYVDELQIRLWGVVAVTDKISIGAELNYFPPMETSSYESWSYSIYPLDSLVYRRQKQDDDIDGTFSPSVTLVYRPISSLEFHFDFAYYATQVDHTSVPPEAWTQKQTHFDRKWFEFGLTYQGKL